MCAKLETEGGVLDKFRAGSRPNFLFYLNGEQVAHVEGVQAPTYEKTVLDFLPEGLLEVRCCPGATQRRGRSNPDP